MTQQERTRCYMLSGFLGAGKTTLLRNLLENTKLKVGCIVNDVAAINIDAKLIRNDRTRENGPNSTSDLADTIELANGCACCSIQDELFASFEQLLTLADRKGSKYDCFVLENSGVAEPQNIRDKFNEAYIVGHPVTERVVLDTMVTIVDAATFSKDYASRTALAARPDLGEGGNRRPVVDLLVEQIECADFVLLNKTDMLEPGQVGSLQDIASSLNPLAKVMPCQWGKIDLDSVFGKASQSLVAHLNVEGQHRGAVAAARANAQKHAHAEEHGHSHEHKHEHQHDHGHDQAHQHSHEHTGDDCGICKTGQMQDRRQGEGHSHAHEHGHAHTHEERQETTAANRFGIRSFVYARRTPFHPQRLRDLVLRWLPVSRNTAIGDQKPEEGASPIKTVLRSKGFMWMSHSHVTAFYWSHAGQHFEIRDEGDWWAAVPDEDWPQDGAQRNIILGDFDLTTQYGDRRQELVFIGADMDEAAISKQLDTALLTPEEMAKYLDHHKDQVDPPHADQEARMKSAQPQLPKH